MADNIRNRNKKSECFFKASKSFLKLGSEFQSRSYGAMVSHTTIVFTRYIILEWLNRNQNDEKTYGELFFMYCEDIQDMDLTNAHCPVKYFLGASQSLCKPPN